MFGLPSKNLVATAAMLAALTLVGCSTPQEKAQSYYNKGKAFLDQGDYVHASVELRNALKIKKDYPDAWFAMAQIEEHDQNWSAMLGDLQKVVELQPNYVLAYQSLARIYFAGGDLSSALKNANLANDKAPNTPENMALRAVILYKLQDAKGARDAVDKILAISPDNLDARTLLATMYSDAGDDAAAIAIVDGELAKNPKAFPLYLIKLKITEKKADVNAEEQIISDMVAKFPDHPEYRSILTNFLIKNGKTAEAEKQLREDLAANPKDKGAGLNLVNFLRETKGADAAQAELQKLKDVAGAPIEYELQLADIEYASGKKEEAYANLRKLIMRLQVSEDGVAAMTDLAAKLLDDNQLTEAEHWISEILKNDSLNAKALKLKGGLELAKGNLDAAIETLRSAQTGATKDSDNHVLLASAYERKGSFDLAASEFNEALRVSNGLPSVAISFAKYLLRRGNADRADEVLSEAVSRAPNDTELVSLLADLKIRKQDWKGAEDLAKMLKQNGVDSGLSSQIMGSALIGQQRYSDAISLFQDSIQNAPDKVQPQFALVRSYIGAGRLDDAQAFVQSMLTANPQNAAAHVLMGSVMTAGGKPDEAKKSFEAAIATDPTLQQAYLAMAEFYFGQKKLDEAISVLASGLPKVKNNENLRMALGAAFEYAQQYDKAIEQYEAVSAQDPESLVAINNFASLVSDYSTDPAKLTQAAEMAKALSNSPLPQFRETYGWISVVSGDTKKGLEVLEQTIAKLDDYGLAHYHLGVAYDKVGEKVLAEQQFARGLSLEKDGVLKSRIAAALEQLKTATP